MDITQAEKVNVSAVVPSRVRKELARRAHDADRSLSAEVRRALTAYVGRDPDNDEEEPRWLTK